MESNERTDGLMGRRTDGRTDGADCIYIMNRWTDGRMDGRTAYRERTAAMSNGQTDKLADERTDGRTRGWWRWLDAALLRHLTRVTSSRHTRHGAHTVGTLETRHVDWMVVVMGRRFGLLHDWLLALGWTGS